VTGHVLRGRHPDPRELAWVRRDFEIASSLQIENVRAPLGIYPAGSGLASVFADTGSVPLSAVRGLGAASLPDFLLIAIQIAYLTGQIHKKRVIHKSLSPESIELIPSSLRVEIGGFGFASTLSRENAVLLTADRIEGDLRYVSPEQTGRMNRNVDYRADYYSMGILFFQMLTGRLPFSSSDPMEMVHAHIALDLPAMDKAHFGAQIPPVLQKIVRKLAAKNAEDRYRSANGIIRDLKECLVQLESTGQVNDFEPGRKDFSDQFLLPQKLYGRDHERETLLDAYSRVCAGKTVFALVSGQSGVGKTSLIQEILKSMTEHGGYFTSGKFDQHKRDVPYSAIMNAFEELIRQLLTESADRLARWRQKLVEAFGMNGQILIDVIPDLALIVGQQAPVPELPPMEARNRFNTVFQDFIRVFARSEHPLTLFIDDLQWADGATLSLLRVLLSDPDLKHLLLVGSYRSNEVNDAHPLTLTLEELRRAGILPLDLKLSGLSEKDVRMLVADSLNLPPQKTALADDLAEVVMRKTEGNPFYAGEFLKSLYQENLIFLDEEEGIFQYDMLHVRARALSEDLLVIISQNIKHLSEGGQTLLRLAACLGGQFDLRTIASCAGMTRGRAAGEIEELLIEGLIIALDDAYKYAAFSQTDDIDVTYRFVHDQVHAAAYSSLSLESRQTNHLHIARTLLETLSFEERDDRILEIVHHLNVGRELILDEKERLRLIELNIQAGRRARDSSAHEESIRLFGVAYDALPPNAAEQLYDLYIGLHRDLGEANYIIGETKQADRYFDRVLAVARSPQEKVRVYELKIAMHAARGNRAEAVRLGLEVLGILGIKIPARPSESQLKSDLQAAQKLLHGKSPERLIEMRAMENPEGLAALRICMQIAAAARTGTGNLFGVVVARMIAISMKQGNAPASAYAYAAYAGLLCSGLGDPALGYQYGRMALDLVEKLEARDMRCRVYYLYASSVHHWQNPAQEASQYLLHAYQAGLETGDLEYVASVIFLLTCAPLWTGTKPLDEISADIDRFGNALYRTGQKHVIELTALCRQYISNLQGGSRNRARLTGERFHEEDAGAEWRNADYSEGLYYLQLFRTRLADLFDQHDSALSAADRAVSYLQAAHGTSSLPFLDLHQGLSAAALSRSAKGSEKKQILAKFEKSYENVARYATLSPSNFKHHEMLLSALRAAGSADHGTAISLFDRAIETARAQNLLMDEAYANELASVYYLDLGQRKFAALYVGEAVRLYRRLNVTAKVEDLENHFPEIVRGGSVQNLTRTEASGNLDLITFAKSAATLSGEIQLENLIDRLLRIVMENSGAQKSHLVLVRDGSLLAAASGNALTGSVQNLGLIPLEECQFLPASVLLLTERTRSPVVLDEAAQDVRFKDDPYIKEVKPRSVLCMPVMLQGRLTSLLYLENNGAPGVFHTGRLESLQVLSAQIATSLENAQLYENLQAALNQERQAKQAQIEVNEAIKRFVPSEFLTLLGKENIVSVQLGDNIAREMTVLFSDIRSFTSISEAMTPEENFRFINSYLKQVGPVVRQHRGFIDKYIGDAIMALFNEPEDAIAASVGMFRALEIWNTGRVQAGYPVVRTGIGIHTGDLMLGTIGEQNRMEGTVISDHVNLASRMEGLTKIYGVSLIISGTTLARLRDPASISFRTLDRVLVKGKQEPVTVIEVLNAESNEVRALKEKTAPLFSEAQQLYNGRQFEAASVLFRKVLSSNPQDRAAAIYFKRCKVYQEKGVPDEWDGVEKLNTK
jgi:predicted ATPase/class 3 adenylate cyclase